MYAAWWFTVLSMSVFYSYHDHCYGNSEAGSRILERVIWPWRGLTVERLGSDEGWDCSVGGWAVCAVSIGIVRSRFWRRWVESPCRSTNWMDGNMMKMSIPSISNSIFVVIFKSHKTGISIGSDRFQFLVLFNSGITGETDQAMDMTTGIYCTRHFIIFMALD